MRTPQRTVRKLLREGREALGVRTNDQVFQQSKKIRDLIASDDPSKAVLIVSPYKDYSWGVYWIDESLREHWVAFPAEDLADPDKIRKAVDPGLGTGRTVS